MDRVAFSPDGKMVLTGSGFNKAQLWDIDTGQPRGAPLPLPHGLYDSNESGVAFNNSVVFSADGRVLLIADGKTVQLWETATGQPIGKPFERMDSGSPVALSPDGRIVLTTSKSAAQLRKAGTWEQLGESLSQEGDIRAAAFSPDGELVVTAGSKSLRVWEVATGKPMGKPVTPISGPIEKVAFSPDTSVVVHGGAMWSVGSPLYRWRLPAERAASLGVVRVPLPSYEVLAFSLDGRTILTGSGNSEMYQGVGHSSARLCDVRTGRAIGAALPHPRAVQAVALSPDGRTIVTGSEDGVRLWDAAVRWERARIWKMPDSPFSGSGHDATTVSPGGKRALTVQYNVLLQNVRREDRLWKNVVQVWDVATSKPLGQPLKLDYTPCKAFSPDGETALVIDAAYGRPGRPGPAPLGRSMDHVVWLWRAGAWTSTLLPGDMPSAVALGPAGKTALLVGSDGTVRLWEVGTWKVIGPPLPHQARVVALSPDGRIAFTGGGLEARLWEAATGKPLGPPLVHQGAIRAAAFSPDSRTVLTGSEDNAVRLWDVATGRQLGAALLHPGVVKALAFSPDGRTILTATMNSPLAKHCGTIHYWDVATGKPLGPAWGPDGGNNSVTFARDGPIAVVGHFHDVWGLASPNAPLEGSVERLVLWAQLSTSRDLDAAGVAGWQTAATWQQRRQRLLELEKE